MSTCSGLTFLDTKKFENPWPRMLLFKKTFNVKYLKCSTLKVDEETFTQAKKRKKLEYDDDDDNDNSSQDEVSPIKIDLKPTRYAHQDGSHLQMLLSKETYNC